MSRNRQWLDKVRISKLRVSIYATPGEYQWRNKKMVSKNLYVSFLRVVNNSGKTPGMEDIIIELQKFFTLLRTYYEDVISHGS